jgi:hypothetical protein
MIGAFTNPSHIAETLALQGKVNWGSTMDLNFNDAGPQRSREEIAAFYEQYPEMLREMLGEDEGAEELEQEAEPAVDPADFFKLILPSKGHLCCAWAPIDYAATRAKKKMTLGKFTHEFTEDFEQLHEHVKRNDVVGRQVYHACASYQTPANRKQENVAWFKAFWFDADVGSDKPYATQEDALDAVWNFCNTTQTPVPLIILSGGGVQGYWPLEEEIDASTWQPHADAFIRAFRKHALEADYACSTDSARVLRPPGSHHRKAQAIDHTADAIEVTVLGGLVRPYKLEEFSHLLSIQDDGPGAQAKSNGVQDGPFSQHARNQANAGRSLALVAEQCGQVALLRDTSGNVSEPLWRAALGVAAFCEDGRELGHKWSSGYTGYSKRETDQKLDRYEKYGPTTCRKFHEINPAVCKGCPSFDKIKSPIRHAKAREGIAQIDDEPQPLMRELPPAVPFPVDELGDLLSNAAKAINDRAQSPMAICAQSVLAAASLAVMGHANVELPINRTVPVALYLICLAVTGERKSTSDDLAMRPIEAFERELRGLYDLDSFHRAVEREAWETTREEIKKKAKGKSRSELEQKLKEHGEAPPALVEPTLLTDEPTIQGLEKHYLVGMPILGLFASEGGKFIHGHSMTDDRGKIRASTSLSHLWDGKPIRRLRAEGGSSFMPGRRLSMHLQIQPDIASVLLADAELKAQGFLSRLLIAHPESLIGSRPHRAEQATTTLHLKAYETHILDLLRTDLPLAKGKQNELEPRVIEMDEEAAELWIAFHDAVEAQMKVGGELHGARALVNKMPEQAARIAAVLILVDTNLVAPGITAEYMARGINLAKHYAAEAVRLNEVAAANTELIKAQGLLDWLTNEWTEPEVSLPEIYQFGPASIRDADTASQLATILAAHGWLREIEGGATIRGKRRRVAWSVVKGVH